MTSRSVAELLQPNVEGRSTAPYGALKWLAIAATRIGDSEPPISHAGLLYRWKKIDVRLFEMRDHTELADATARPDFVWIELALPQERLQLVIGRARLIHKSHKEKVIPYGFGYRTSAFDKNGGLRLGSGEIGFTCATIVAAILESECVPLIDPTAWPAPDDNDKATRQGFIDRLRTKHPEHASLLAKDIESPRIAPEEVVAAAALFPKVGTFDPLQEGAAVVRSRIRT